MSIEDTGWSKVKVGAVHTPANRQGLSRYQDVMSLRGCVAAAVIFREVGHPVVEITTSACGLLVMASLNDLVWETIFRRKVLSDT